MGVSNGAEPLLAKFASPLPPQQWQANICAVKKVAQLQPGDTGLQGEYSIQRWISSKESQITWSCRRNITPLPFPTVSCACMRVCAQVGGRVRRWRSSGAVAMAIKYLHFRCRMVASSLKDGDFEACNWAKAFSEEQRTRQQDTTPKDPCISPPEVERVAKSGAETA